MKFNPSIFREYDIRGIAGRDLSSELAYAIGNAYVKFIETQFISNRGAWGEAVRAEMDKKSPNRPIIAVGRDCRLTSDEYAEALIRGLNEAGANVVNLGTCPTPVTYFSVFNQHLDGAIMITGSHNPGDYNGFKIGVGKDTLHGSQIQEMKNLVEAGPHSFSSGKGSVTKLDIIPLYQNFLVQSAKKLKPMKVVVDAGNGTASTVAPELFKRLGAEVIPLFCELDGRFPNHHPDPTVVSNLKHMIDAVKKEGAHFGVAFDGDSDRIGIVDEKGGVLFGDEMMILFARDVLKEKPGATVISEVKSSYRLYDDIAKRGGNPIMWKTGHSLIKSKMKETKAMLAGEMSGHIFFADRYFGYDDAIYAALRFYEIASSAQGPVSSLLADVEKTVNTPEIRIDCVEELKFSLVEKTKARLIAQKNGKVNDIDGIRIDFGDGWGLVRASNTQPVLVLRFESKSERRMNEIRSIVESALVSSAQELKHPPLELHGSKH